MSFSKISVFLLVTIFLSCHSQMLHSVTRIEKALQARNELADLLSDHIQKEAGRLEAFTSLVKQLNETKQEKVSRRQLEKMMSHPVRAFRIVADMFYSKQSVEDAMEGSKISSDLTALLDSLPGYSDLVGASLALARLQDIYKDEGDFTPSPHNHSITKNDDDLLTADEVYDIAMVFLKDENYYQALKYFTKVKDLYLADGLTENAIYSLDNLAYIMHELGHTEIALNYTYEVIEFYKMNNFDKEDMDRILNNIAVYNDILGGEVEAKRKASSPRRFLLESKAPPVEENYAELCRGESVQMPEGSEKPLSCHLVTNNNPLLLLTPAKVEEIAEEAGLSFYHDVITDKEIELFKRLADAKLGDSELLVKTDETKMVMSERSSKNGWVDDSEHEVIYTISRRLQAITGLSISNAELYQVLSYGVGGFYLPHYDFTPENTTILDYQGNRIATWIFYLNDVAKGGATAFPRIGKAVWPKKGGAAFWWNLYRNGTVNTNTLHAACPVLEGFKWASNKWFHEGENEFSHPCSLNSLD